MLLEHFSLLAQIEFRTFRWCLTFLPAAPSPSLAVAYRQLYLLAAFCLLSSPQLSLHTLEYRSLLSAWVAWICGDNASRSPEMMKLNLGLPFPSALSSSLTKATKLLFLPFLRLEQWITEWLFKKYYKRLKDFPAAQCNHKDAPNRFRSHSSLFIDSDVVAKRCYGMRYKMKSFQIRAKGWGKWISSLLRTSDQGMLSSCGLRKSWDCCDEDAGGWNSITNVKESPLLSPSSLSRASQTYSSDMFSLVWSDSKAQNAITPTDFKAPPTKIGLFLVF